MELLDQNQQKANQLSADSSNLSPNASGFRASGSQAKGSSILDSNFNETLNQNLSGLDANSAKTEASKASGSKGSSDLAIDENKAGEKMGTCQFAGTAACNCNKTKTDSSSELLDASNPKASKGTNGDAGADPFHISLGNVDVVRGVNLNKLQKEFSFTDDIGAKGDFLIPGAGKNTVTGTGDKDLFDGRGGGFNTITTGGGKDSILLDSRTTNHILDFDLNVDRLLFTKDIDPSNIVIAQGKNTSKEGGSSPLDSVNNTLIIDKSDGHILASLESTKASALQGMEQRKGFSSVDEKVFNTLNEVKFDKTQEGNGQLAGTSGRDKLIGGKGNDTLLGESTGTSTPPGGSTGGSTGGGDDHDHTGAGASSENHVALDQVDGARGLDLKNLKKELSFTDDIGAKGDFLVPGAGKNTVIGTGDKDLIDGRGGGFNTITTGGGKDSILLDDKTTNRILDFDPTLDRLLFTEGMDLNNIVIAQGKNPGKGGVNQPLDSVNNALVIDKSDGHILASLAFTKATALEGLEQSVRKGFSLVDDKVFDTLSQVNFGKTQEGSGQLTGTLGRDKLVGGKGDDFLYVGDDGFKLETAKGGGGTEFPFKTDSPGTSELTPELKNGVLSFSGSYKDFDGAPLFSQGEKKLDPNAKILSGADPQALTDGFLKVPEDKEGNAISGTHLHFSPAEDSRGNFADATVVRYFENTPIDAKSGTLSGKFELSPEEQAAFLAGDLYVNIHSNIDLDGDGRAGFATGENRLNFNKNVVRLV